jgi:hypothetical protein
LNPWTMGLMANTVTITPLRKTSVPLLKFQKQRDLQVPLNGYFKSVSFRNFLISQTNYLLLTEPKLWWKLIPSTKYYLANHVPIHKTSWNVLSILLFLSPNSQKSIHSSSTLWIFQWSHNQTAAGIIKINMSACPTTKSLAESRMQTDNTNFSKNQLISSKESRLMELNSYGRGFESHFWHQFVTFSGFSIRDGTLLHSKFNTLQLNTVGNSSRILTHVQLLPVL